MGVGGIDSEAARHKARREAVSGVAGAKDIGDSLSAKPASAAKGGQAASGQLSGEAARHRAHRASLMGPPLKQQAATQVKSSGDPPLRRSDLGHVACRSCPLIMRGAGRWPWVYLLSPKPCLQVFQVLTYPSPGILCMCMRAC